jgi:D-tyrosyl-tRNA(Tyr) deacylase
MKAVVQRVTRSEVHVDNRCIGAIEHGLLVLLGVDHDDADKEIRWMADKIINLRIFEDLNGKMNRSLRDTGGAMLVVSQFTLMGDCRKGRRPSFAAAAPPDRAESVYEQFIATVRHSGIEVATGQFGAMMQVALVNDGPVTLILKTPDTY